MIDTTKAVTPFPVEEAPELGDSTEPRPGRKRGTIKSGSNLAHFVQWLINTLIRVLMSIGFGGGPPWKFFFKFFFKYILTHF